MSALREAAQQALEALEEYAPQHGRPDDMMAAITALRAALAQEQAEPLNLSDRAVQQRLAAQWGYVPAALAEPAQKFKPTPLTQEQMDAPLLRAMVPLTEREIGKLTAMFDARHSVRVGIARAIEKASWEKNHGQA